MFSLVFLFHDAAPTVHPDVQDGSGVSSTTHFELYQKAWHRNASVGETPLVYPLAVTRPGRAPFQQPVPQLGSLPSANQAALWAPLWALLSYSTAACFQAFSPSLLLSHSPISLFASPVVIYVVVSMEHWPWAKPALSPSSWPPPWFQELDWTTPVPLCTDP